MPVLVVRAECVELIAHVLACAKVSLPPPRCAAGGTFLAAKVAALR